MHITIITNGFQQEYSYNLLNNLVDKVERIDFIGSPLYDKNRLDPRICIYNLRANQEGRSSGVLKLLRILNYYRKLFTYLFQTKSKLVHVQWLRFDFIEGVLITLMMQLMGKKVIYTAHNVLPHDKRGMIYDKKFALIYRIQDEIIVHTLFIKNQIVDSFAVKPDKIHVVPHGVYEKEMNQNITRQSARKKLELKEDSTVILFFGIIQAYKGFDILTKSIDLLEGNSDYEIVVAGKVASEYKKEFEIHKQRTQNKNYTYLLKYLSDEEVEDCFKAADITVLPYKEASQSGVLFMSYTYGLPVIAPNLGGFPEDVFPGITGYLFEPNDAYSLACSVKQLNRDLSNGYINSQVIKKIAAENYSWHASCQKVCEVYHHALSNNGKLAD